MPLAGFNCSETEGQYRIGPSPANGAVAMKHRIMLLVGLVVIVSAPFFKTLRSAVAQDDPETAQIRAADEQLVKAFDAGKPDEVAALFLPKGELIDEQGTV